MIKIYPSKLEGEPIESHKLERETTIAQWLFDHVPGFSLDIEPRISVCVNESIVNHSDWHCFNIGPGDDVKIYIEPKAGFFAVGLLLVGGGLALAGAALGGLLYSAFSSTPKLPSSYRGSELEAANAKGNQAKLNSVIREVFGHRRIYPDYLVPPRRYFVDKRIEWIEMLLCVGVGKFFIDPSLVQIGETPIGAYGPNASYTIYQPGADLSADSAADHWHEAPEVGTSGAGSAGLDLSFAASGSGAPAGQYVLSGKTLSSSGANVQWPDDWAVGDNLRIEAYRDYTVAAPVNPGEPNAIIGPGVDELEPYTGMLIEIEGDNVGEYIVADYDPMNSAMTLLLPSGIPATNLQTGTCRMAIGYRGMLYRVTSKTNGTSTTPATIGIERLTDTGAIDTPWSGFSSLTITDSDIELIPAGAGEWVGPFLATPKGELTDTLEWSVFFPGGLIRVNDEGKTRGRSVTVEFQWRDSAAGGSWNSVTKTYSDATKDQLGFTERLTLPYAMAPEVRMRRTTVESTKTNISEKVQWYSLRAKLPIKKQYEGVTVLSVKVRGGDFLSMSAENLVSVQATRILPVWNGSAWVEQPTRDIYPAIRYIAQDLGMPDSQIDTETLQVLQSIWSSRGDLADVIFDGDGTVRDRMNALLQAGWAEVVLKDGVISAARDAKRTTPPMALYSPQAQQQELVRSVQAITDNDFDGVDVKYVNAATWATETIECRIGPNLPQKVESIELAAVTDRTRAWRIGMRRLRSHLYRRWAYEFGTEMAAFSSQYLDHVAVSEDVPRYETMSAVVRWYDPEHLTLEVSEPMPFGSAPQYVIGLRRPDGTLSGPYHVTKIDDYTLQLNTQLDFEPVLETGTMEPTHVAFGPLNKLYHQVLITSIEPRSTEIATVSAIEYNELVYADDDNEPS